jgi:hypothetical protein
MKSVTAILSFWVISGVASAPSADPSKWMCRNLADSGGFLYQGETIFGSQACSPIPQVTQAQAATTVAPAAAPVSAATSKQDAGDAFGAAAAGAVPATPLATQTLVVPGQPAAQTRPCLIVRQAEGHRFRNSMIAGALTGGIGFAAGAAGGGAKYEYVDAYHLSRRPELKYNGKQIQKLEADGVHIVTVSKEATGDEIKDARESSRQ